MKKEKDSAIKGDVLQILFDNGAELRVRLGLHQRLVPSIVRMLKSRTGRVYPLKFDLSVFRGDRFKALGLDYFDPDLVGGVPPPGTPTEVEAELINVAWLDNDRLVPGIVQQRLSLLGYRSATLDELIAFAASRENLSQLRASRVHAVIVLDVGSYGRDDGRYWSCLYLDRLPAGGITITEQSGVLWPCPQHILAVKAD